jgi:hypothetical protein
LGPAVVAMNPEFIVSVGGAICRIELRRGCDRYGRRVHHCTDCSSCETPPRFACGAARRACVDRTLSRVVRDDHVASAHRDRGGTQNACVRRATLRVPASVGVRHARNDDPSGTHRVGAQERRSVFRDQRITPRFGREPTERPARLSLLPPHLRSIADGAFSFP